MRPGFDGRNDGHLDRRQFALALAAVPLTLSAVARAARAAAKARLVIVGGGPAEQPWQSP